MGVRIVGIDKMSHEEVQSELDRGGRFVMFEYCISLVVVTMRRPSNIHLVRADESPVRKSMPFIVLSLLLGWWGIPWGPIHTCKALYTNLTGGHDVTTEVTAQASQPLPRADAAV